MSKRVGRREQRHAKSRARSRPAFRRRWYSFLPEAVVVLLLVAAFVSFETDAGARLGLVPDPAQDPAAVAPPLSLPTMRAAGAVAEPQTAASAVTAKLRTTLTPYLTEKRLGPHVRMVVSDLTSGQQVFSYGTGTVTPASTTKLLTSVSALESVGPAERFATKVLRGRGKRIVLVGGGDPFLNSSPPPSDTYPHYADVTTLAKKTAAALKQEGTKQVSLGYDDSLFTGPAFNPSWPATYRPDVAPPISALWVDEGRAPTYGFVDDPSRTAADTFRAALERRGVTVLGEPIHQTAPEGVARLAQVRSPTVGQIVSRLLLVSDNNAAEVMAHHVGIAEGTGGSFTGGVAGVRKALGRLGVPLTSAQLYDGSGLSRRDRMAPNTLLAVIRAAASSKHPALRQVITGVPVAGFSGSLTNRFDSGAVAARGRVRAKTGTLTGVHGLAGTATDLDGDVLGFVVVADRVAEADNGYAQEQLDRAAAALGGCHCGGATTSGASGTSDTSGQTPGA